MLTQPFSVCQILGSARSQLGAQESSATDVRDISAFQVEGQVVSIGLVKREPIDSSQKLDEVWLGSHAIAVALMGKEPLGDTVGRDRCTKRGQGTK